MEQQAKGIGQETVTAQPVGPETVLKFLDAVLALAAVVVKGKHFLGAAGKVGNDEAQVGSGGGVFGFVTDAALAGPSAGAVAEAGETALGKLAAAVTALELFL